MGDTIETFLCAGAESAEEACDMLVAAGLELIRAARVSRTVLDTFDGRLHAAGMRLEAQHDRRLELVLTQDGSPSVRIASDTVPRTSSDLPSGPFRARVAGVVDDRALLERATVVARHTVAEAVDENDKIVVRAVIHDEISVPEAPDVNVPWTVEITAMAGYPKPAARLVGELAEHGFSAVHGDTMDLAMAACGIDPRGAPSTPTVPLDPCATAAEGYRDVLAHLRDTIVANLPGAADDLDPEFLHDLRIAVRRTRSVLAAAKHVLPRDVRRRFRHGFGDLQRLTGSPRDLDVYVLGWDDLVAGLPAEVVGSLEPVAERLRSERARAHAELSRALRGPQVTALLDEWSTYLASPSLDPDDAARKAADPLGPLAADRVRTAQKALLDDGRAIADDAPADELHRLRKDAKQLRYLVECFGGLAPPELVRSCTKRLKAIQDNLGAFQDGHVQAELVAEMAPVLAEQGAPTHTLVALGRLTAELEQRSAQARAEFPERFASYDRPSTTRRFERLAQAMVS
jgi:CHAD domain-containing protein